MAELIWDGKYDKNGKRVAPLRVSLPFQTVETVNESAQERQRTLDLFSTGRDPEWRNRLIWGDKKYVLPSLLPEFAGKVDLIYIDPPFATGADFSFRATIPSDGAGGAEGAGFTKEPSLIEQKAYRDTWGRGLDGYLQWFYESVSELRALLSSHGSVYVHLDWHVAHYAKVILDEVLGDGCFQNEIIWERSDPKGHAFNRYPSAHDTLLYYSMGAEPRWNPGHREYDEAYLRSHYSLVEEGSGRHYTLSDCTNPNKDRPNLTYEWHGVTKVWRWTRERMEQLDKEGRLIYTKSGAPRYKRYLDEMPGAVVTTVWNDIPFVNSQAVERLNYPTQKPESLLERIVKTSSNEGDLILDCFAGSGTTAAIAEKCNRRWIASDLGRFAIHTTRKRLLSIPNVRPFVVQNLGKYERQAWQGAEFGDGAEIAYRRFILNLYHAQPLDGYAWLHGLKYGHLVHVGSVDAPVSAGDITQIAIEYRRVMGSGENAPQSNRIDILGWDFAFELNEVAKQQAALANIDFHFVRIPREVLEKKAVEQGDIRFFELAALSVDLKQKDQTAFLTLTDFVIPLDDVPEDVQRAITHWSQWIDYWAVDWDNKSDTFHNQWQTYRTRKCPELQSSTSHTYDEPGLYTVVVKVIDILGNDTTKTLRIEVL